MRWGIDDQISCVDVVKQLFWGIKKMCLSQWESSESLFAKESKAGRLNNDDAEKLPTTQKPTT